MSLANRLLNNPGLIALTVPEERVELSAPLGRAVRPLRLQYLQGSKKKGLALWNVLSPQLPNYPTNGGVNGWPTFSVLGLQQNGLI